MEGPWRTLAANWNAVGSFGVNVAGTLHLTKPTKRALLLSSQRRPTATWFLLL
jgi:hypothetical protein